MQTANLLDSVTGVETHKSPIALRTINMGETVDEVVDTEIDVDADFHKARARLNEVSDIAQQGLAEMMRLALVMQEPRVFDMLSKMINSSVAAHKATLEIHKNRQEGKDANADQPVQNVTHNNLILTTAELQKQIEQAVKKIESNGS